MTSKRTRSPQSLYVMQCGRYSKIGIAERPHRRCRNINAPMPVQLCWMSARFDYAKDLEKIVHARVKDEGFRVYIEWSDCPVDQAIALCERAVSEWSAD